MLLMHFNCFLAHETLSKLWIMLDVFQAIILIEVCFFAMILLSDSILKLIRHYLHHLLQTTTNSLYLFGKVKYLNIYRFQNRFITNLDSLMIVPIFFSHPYYLCNFIISASEYTVKLAHCLFVLIQQQSLAWGLRKRLYRQIKKALLTNNANSC